MFLDNRIHRTVKLGIDLCNSPIYQVYVTSNGGINTLNIQEFATGNLIASIVCKYIFTPPACGTPIAESYNSYTQKEAGNIDPGVYRIFELNQNLCEDVNTQLIVRSTSTSGAPEDAIETLQYTPAGSTNQISMTFNDKIPPKLN
jgi:hypothetical protein